MHIRSRHFRGVVQPVPLKVRCRAPCFKRILYTEMLLQLQKGFEGFRRWVLGSGFRVLSLGHGLQVPWALFELRI